MAFGFVSDRFEKQKAHKTADCIEYIWIDDCSYGVSTNRIFQSA